MQDESRGSKELKAAPSANMVDLAGYVIILVQTQDGKIKLYGSPAEKNDLEIGDEILEVNGRILETCSHEEILTFIHECIKSRVICLRVKRRTSARVAAELAHSVQDAFVIAVEQQARERLERLSQLKRIKPVDMNKLCDQRPGSPSRPGPSRESSQSRDQWNGIIDHKSVFVTSLGPAGPASSEVPSTSGTADPSAAAGAQKQQPSGSSGAGASHAPRLTNGHGAPSGTSTGAESGSGLGASFEEVELKQDLDADAGGSPTTAASPEQQQQQRQPPARSLQDRRASSPFTNGRTELLIPANTAGSLDQDGHGHRMRTTALVEPGADEAWSVRPRRSIVGSVSGSKAAEADLGLRMLAGDAIPLTRDYRAEPLQPLQPLQPLHREMAVDVPDSFIARSKTPPRYPPPRPVGGTQGATQGVNGSAVKPVPPPRAHLRIEEDGRLVNRAPAPQLPARPPDNNNDPDKEPTKEQLTSIRKYQEQLRQRKAEEERQAAQTEFLNRSLRGSRKLQALQEPQPPLPPLPPSQGQPDKRVGVVNDGYSSAEDADLEPELPVDDPAVVLHRIIGYGELVASIQRLQLQLKKTGNSTISGGGYSALEGQVAAVQTLLLSPAFGRALAVHNKVQEVSGQLHTQPDSQPVTSHAQGLLRDCLDVIQPCTLPEATELAELLTRYDIEGLLLAHDTLASHDIALVSPTMSEVERILPEEPSLLPPITPSHTPVHTTPAHVTTSINEEHIKIIKIEKTNEPLGATVRNEGDAVMIGRVVRGGAAEKTGLLHQGDEVLEVNGVAMRGKSVNEVCDILAAMTGTLTFFVVPAAKVALPPPPVRDALMHVRAHFDYDPEDDLFIPCRELGVSFQKGDVLHVISQEDPNWWQAYREGEEDQTLAGLIPSKSFQHQREAYKQASIATTDPKEKTKKASTLLCAKKNAKKKSKKKGYGSSYVDGNYPLYSSSTTDDYESEEILTYEEVALYYPRANHKRPVVLIGPPNIGRHELRQRLMEDSERFAAAIPHTSRARKESEVDGQDYHFITRQQFEADILARKFVEHGEYERAYYGTSLDAIRSVVAAGKICVLNLHPQSLRILRNSDLKPYVVLVAPPALEKLRQKKLRNGEAFKEEELKETIEKAREMEEKYGHMLDLVIINSDTERAFSQLLSEINSLEREPQWVPTAWVKQQ